MGTDRNFQMQMPLLITHTADSRVVVFHPFEGQDWVGCVKLRGDRILWVPRIFQKRGFVNGWRQCPFRFLEAALRGKDIWLPGGPGGR